MQSEATHSNPNTQDKKGFISPKTEWHPCRVPEIRIPTMESFWLPAKPTAEDFMEPVTATVLSFTSRWIDESRGIALYKER